MNFLNKMERQYGRYAIHNLTKYMIGCYAIGYILLYIGQAFGANFFQYLLLSPYFRRDALYGYRSVYPVFYFRTK